MIERQIRYNFKTNTTEQDIFTRYRWVFLIINEPREIDRIREKIYFQLAPVQEVRNLDKGLINSSGGLHYHFFSFFSEKGKIEEPSKIYNSNNFKKDRDLSERDEIKLTKYLDSILTGRKK